MEAHPRAGIDVDTGATFKAVARLASDVRSVAGLTLAAAALALIRLATSDLPVLAQEPPPAAATCTLEEQDLAAVERITPAQALALHGRDGVTFVDARTHHDYLAGHIPGALSLPSADAAGILEVSSVPIGAHDLVVTYCDTIRCERSESLGLLLQDRAGCEQVRVLEGGFSSWVRTGGPVSIGVER